MNENNLLLLLRMTEQAETMQENEFKTLLSDKDTRAYYETMVMLKQAFQVKTDAASVYSLHAPSHNRMWSRYVATVIITLFAMVSIVFAAVLFWNGKSGETSSTVEWKKTTTEKAKEIKEIGPTAKISKKTYVNEPLEVVLSDIARYYGMDVIYSNPHTPTLRLHFVWNPNDDIDTVIGFFNHFDNIEINREKNTLYVN